MTQMGGLTSLVSVGSTAVALALVLPACAAGTGVEDGAESPGSADGGSRTDGTPPALDQSGVLATPEARFGALIGFATDEPEYAACFSMDPADTTVDCTAAECLALRSCCVGDGACCAAVTDAPLPAEVDFARCGDEPAVECLERGGVVAEELGGVAPRVIGGRFEPGGDLGGEGGLLVGGAVDLRQHRVLLEVDFGPTPACDESPCVESVGAGLVMDGAAAPPVRPVASLLYVAEAGEVRLVVRDVVIARAVEVAPDDAEWVLELAPDGRLRALRGGVLIDDTWDVVFAPSGAARLVIYGRNASAASGGGASLDAVRARVSVCDIPDAWSSRALLDLREPGDESAASAALFGGPSVATLRDGSTLLAMQVDGALRLARRAATDPPSRFELDAARDAVSESAGPHEVGGRAEPELLSHDDGVALFYTARDANGVRSIGRADSTSGDFFIARPAPVLSPDGVATLGFDHPTVALAFDGTWVLVARAERADGAHELRVHASIDGGLTFTELGESRLPAVTRGRDESLEGASLVVHNGAWQVFVGLRVGTRVHTELLASDDLVFFRGVSDEVLLPSSGTLDRLGVREVDVQSLGDSLEAVYLAAGDTGTRPARAARPAPRLGVRGR